jgi:hypothetical protein
MHKLLKVIKSSLNPHIHCRTPTLAKCGGEAQHLQSWGFGVLRDSWMFRAQQQGPKHLALGCSWCHWKGLETYISKMASHWSFEDLQPKLWAKEGLGVKLAVWLPTTKSQESTSSWHLIWECNITLKISQQGLQLWFKPRCDRTLQSGVMVVQSSRNPAGTISGLHFWSPNKMCHLDVGSMASCREYYMGQGGGFPWVRAVVSLMCQSAHGLSQHPRVFPNAKLTSCVGFWMQIHTS